MSRIPLAFESADIAALARSLKQQLTALGELPSHVQLLNMLAKSAGYRNFQHLKAEAEAAPPIAVAPVAPPPPIVDEQRVARVAGHFGPLGELLRWPSRTNHQELCCWVLWSRLPAELVLHEREISAWLNDQHEFGDAALLRRTLVTMGLVTRTQDGREYRRIEQKPPAELLALLARLKTVAA
ncbi:MAG: DUF2087 domain-containing protein [Hyphomicrobiales bacterium]|nr:MAG: DUF2087 domain-containing protein [Hyphomicrobiales bacterium]